MTDNEYAQFIELFTKFAREMNENSVKKGFWDERDDIVSVLRQHGRPDLANRVLQMSHSEKIALMHSELSESLEALRAGGGLPDKHCAEFSNLEIESADLLIRRMETDYSHGLRTAAAMVAKHRFNMTRPAKHGKAF